MTLEIRTFTADQIAPQLPRWESYVFEKKPVPLSRHPVWMEILRAGLGHIPYALEASEDGRTTGLLFLAEVRSWLFGRYLVSLPYVNYGGVLAETADAATALIDQAVSLADRLGVRFLELRHQEFVSHPALVSIPNQKVNMPFSLPASAEQLWQQLSAKVRNQIRKAQKQEFTVAWGGLGLLRDFYAVFSRNMRDLGTPVYPRRLFESILSRFPDRAEIAVVREGANPVAVGLILHGEGISEVPSAASLREYRSANANMLLYWHLLERAIERKQEIFDFGRSNPDSSTLRFKSQWGALPRPAEWRYYVRRGDLSAMRADNPRFRKLIRVWRRLPVSVTRWIGPWIVRGIPS